MNAVTLAWVLGGALCVLVAMFVVLMIARSLDGSRTESKQQFAAKLSELASKAKPAGGSQGAPGWVTGTVVDTLIALSKASKEAGDDDASARDGGDSSRKQIKQLLTGLAIAGGIIMLIVGIITGDGS